MNEADSRSSGDHHENPELQRLVAMYVDRLIEGDRIEPLEIVASHPEYGERIVEELRTFTKLGVGKTDDEALGTLGDYTLRRQIGRGGMGVVYEAWQNSMDRRVALKVLPVGIAADTKACARFMREAQTAGKLNHQSIVGVHSTGIEEGTPWYSMEYVEGETLAQILAKLRDAEPDTETRFGPKDQVDYFARLARAFADVADGLQHAHSRGVIHRDIKPSNLILDADGKLRILDFGLARLEGQESLTLSGDLIGTVLYMSPEQAMAKRIPLDHRTDVYSLGATMYEALTGQPLFKGKDQHDTLSQIIVRDPRSPRQLNTSVPVDLETIVLKCLRKNAADRYGTAEALAQDLRRFVRGDAIEARPEAALERLTRRLRRLRKTLAVAATLVLVLAYAGWQVHEKSQLEVQRIRDDYERTVRRAATRIGQVVFTLKPGTGKTRDMIVSFGSGPRAPVTGAELRNFWGMARSASVKAAIGELERITRTLPEERDAHYHLAKAYAVTERHEDAKREIGEALRCDPGFVPALVLRWELTGRKEAVFDEMRAACETGVSPAWQEHWLDAYKWSSEADSKRMWREVAAVYERLLEVTGTEEPYIGFTLEVAMGRGLALLEAGEVDLARDAFVEAKTLMRSSFEGAGPALGVDGAVLLFGKACWRGGNRKRAARVFEDLYSSAGPQEKDEAALLIAAVYRSLDEPREALYWVDWVGESPLKQRLRAFFLLRLGKREDAIEAGRRAIAGDPEDPIAHMVLGWALREELLSREHPGNQRSEFVRVARRAAELAPDHGLAQNLGVTADVVDGDGRRLRRTVKGRAPGFIDPPERLPFSNGMDQGGEITADGLDFYLSGSDLDICKVTRPQRNAPWGEPRPVEEINSSDMEGAVVVSSDGLELYLGRRIAWQPSSLHVSTRESRDAPWSEPRRLEIDSDVRDIPGSLSADGLTLYFASDRLVDARGVTNLGGTDLFYATRPAVRDAQGNRVPFQAETVTNLREINTGLDEISPRISPDGRVLFWSDGPYRPSAGPRPGGEGESDVWIAVRAGTEEPFHRSTIMNLGWPVNTVVHEFLVSLSSDWPASGSKLYLLRGSDFYDSWLYAATWHPDCNANGIDDQDDLASGVSVDKDGDGRPDDCGCPELDFGASRELWTLAGPTGNRRTAVLEKGKSYEVRIELSPVADPAGGQECEPPRELTVTETIEVDPEHAARWIVEGVSHGGTARGETVTWALEADEEGRFPATLTYTLTAGGGGGVSFSGEVRARGRFSASIQGEAAVQSTASLRPISDFASIQRWLILGPFTHDCGRSGSGKVNCGNPGEDRIRLDYLTDGVVTEATIRPREGDTIEPDYGRAAASTRLAPSFVRRNPKDVPTWIAWYDPDDEDDLIDFEAIYGLVDNVMCYAVTYLDVLEDIEVRFGVSSDDSIQVLLDGEPIHLNNIARGGAKREYNDILEPVTLEGGRRHTLMVKVFDGRLDHNFRVGFVDDRGRPLDRTTTPSLDFVQEVIEITLEPPP